MRLKSLIKARIASCLNKTLHIEELSKPDMLSQLCTVLLDVVLPNLKRIQTNQAEQRLLSDQLHQSCEQFREEMLSSFTAMRSELAATRAELDIAQATLRAIEDAQSLTISGKKLLIH